MNIEIYRLLFWFLNINSLPKRHNYVDQIKAEKINSPENHQNLAGGRYINSKSVHDLHICNIYISMVGTTLPPSVKFDWL